MDYYHVIKTIHIVSVMSWMAGLLYLPRIFVYHSSLLFKSESSELFKIMEFRLLSFIMTPAMIFAWGSGLILAYEAAFLKSGWFHWKLFFVFLLSGLHGALARFYREFSLDAPRRDSGFFRILNEVPTVLMILIVALVVAKGF